jgi:hypothetical protein
LSLWSEGSGQGAIAAGAGSFALFTQSLSNILLFVMLSSVAWLSVAQALAGMPLLGRGRRAAAAVDGAEAGSGSVEPLLEWLGH